jgi:hypothetical protein
VDKRFLTAFIAPAKWDLVGFELNPFCIKHILVLHALNSPYIKQDRFPSPAETIQFLRVCSSDNPNAFSIKPGWLDSLFAGRLFVDVTYHSKVAKGIVHYITQYSSQPKIIKKETDHKVVIDSKPDDIPSLLMMLTAAMSKLNMTEEEGMNMALGKLAWYGAAYAVLEGAEIRFISTDAEERLELERLQIIEHENEMKQRLLQSMKNGKIASKPVRTTSQ